MQCAFVTVNRRMLNFLSPIPAAIFQYTAHTTLTALTPTLVKLFASNIGALDSREEEQIVGLCIINIIPMK